MTWPADRARSLCIDAVASAIRDNVSLLVLAAGVTKEQFDRQNPGVVRALAAQATDAVMRYLETGDPDA